MVQRPPPIWSRRFDTGTTWEGTCGGGMSLDPMFGLLLRGPRLRYLRGRIYEVTLQDEDSKENPRLGTSLQEQTQQRTRHCKNASSVR